MSKQGKDAAARRYREMHKELIAARVRERRQARRESGLDAPSNPCACGCGKLCRRRFVPGHNFKAPDDGLTRAQRNYRKNREKRLAQSIEYGRKHSERRKKYLKAWYAKNREKSLAKRKAWAKANPETEKARKQAWVKANPERVRQLKKLSNLRNPDAYRARTANSNHKRRAGATSHGVKPTEWLDIRRDFGFRCAYCGEARRQFTQDHVVPLSAGGLHARHNVVPACPRCNASKGARSILLWVASCGMPSPAA
jgi:5-methylcytosine-specific restriction endonuclease McrA